MLVQWMVTLLVPLDQKANGSLAKKFIFVQRFFPVGKS